jgi:hypothetical protein
LNIIAVALLLLGFCSTEQTLESKGEKKYTTRERAAARIKTEEEAARKMKEWRRRSRARRGRTDFLQIRITM